MNTRLPSRHAIIDVSASRNQVALDRILKHGERVPIIITGYIVGGDDPDAVSQEFAVSVLSMLSIYLCEACKGLDYVQLYLMRRFTINCRALFPVHSEAKACNERTGN